MATVTIPVPDEVYRQAERLAAQTGRDLHDILATLLRISLPPLNQPLWSNRPVETLSDAEVLMLADSRMDTRQNARMSELLDKQQADTLDEIEHLELSLLLYVYQQGSLRKAQALLEAKSRGTSNIQAKNVQENC